MWNNIGGARGELFANLSRYSEEAAAVAAIRRCGAPSPVHGGAVGRSRLHAGAGRPALRPPTDNISAAAARCRRRVRHRPPDPVCYTASAVTDGQTDRQQRHTEEQRRVEATGAQLIRRAAGDLATPPAAVVANSLPRSVVSARHR